MLDEGETVLDEGGTVVDEGGTVLDKGGTEVGGRVICCKLCNINLHIHALTHKPPDHLPQQRIHTDGNG